MTEEIKTKTNVLPLIPLRAMVAFPNTTLSFEVGRDVTVRAVNRCTANGDRLIFLCAQKSPQK